MPMNERAIHTQAGRGDEGSTQLRRAPVSNRVPGKAEDALGSRAGTLRGSKPLHGCPNSVCH